jgi:adenosylcobinamide kinase/adenosylcobinamide-phosphate guanylyltransferase
MQGNKLILITGGARSGKSRFAEELAEQLGKPRTFIATAQIYDEEMQERVRVHKERRAEHWITREAPFDTAAQIIEAGNDTPVILVDCLTLFVTNHLLKELPADHLPGSSQKHYIDKVLKAVDKFVIAAKSVPASVIVVTNEVGSGIVPDNALSRMFRDAAGMANQRLAAVADEVFFMVSGLPVQVKSLSS